MAESTKLTEVPPNWDPDRWWDHVASCDACSKRYEDPRPPAATNSGEAHAGAVGWPVVCAECGDELEQPGALAFSPPRSDDEVTKYHICRECWKWMLGTMRLLQNGGRGANVTVDLDRVLESVELAEGSPVRQETYLVQKWFESERGWGQRPDGWSLHRNRDELDAYVKAYWDSMPLVAPDEYSAPDGEPRVYPGSVFTDEQIAKLDDSTNGARFWGHPPEVG